MDDFVVEGWGHADGAAGEIWVVVLAFGHGDAGWGVAVAGEEVEDVVFAVWEGGFFGRGSKINEICVSPTVSFPKNPKTNNPSSPCVLP